MLHQAAPSASIQSEMNSISIYEPADSQQLTPNTATGAAGIGFPT